MSDWPTMYKSVPICDECGLPIPVCDEVAPFRREVRVLKRKLAAAEARIAELETELKVLRECEAPLKAATKRSRMVDRKTVAPYIPNSEAEELP